MAEDTDSDWDSSVLDFSTTTPRGFRLGFANQTNRDMGAIEETAENSAGEPGCPKTDLRPSDIGKTSLAVPAANYTNNATPTNIKAKSSSLQRNNSKNATSKDPSSTKSPSNGKMNPPFNFTGMFTSGGNGDDTVPKLSGKSRKGNRYDPTPEGEGNSSHESDADERILQEARETFPKSRQSQRANTGNEKEDIVNKKNKEIATEKKHANQVTIVSNKQIKRGLGSFEKFDSPLGTQKTVLSHQSDVDRTSVPDGAKRHVYRYEHGSMEYCEVGVAESAGVMSPLADKVEGASRRALVEVFGCLRLGVVFIVLFLVELVRFVCGAVVTPLVTGVFAILGNALLKPVFVALFNCCVHPVFSLVFNVMTGLKHALTPLLDITREVIGQIASLLRAFRLVEVNHVTNASSQLEVV